MGEKLRELQEHTDWINSVAFSPDGNQIVSGSSDKSVQVWDDLNHDVPWHLKEDGWILSGAEMLVWVPSTICNVLLCPHNTLIFSREGSAKISFVQCKLGPSWHESYTP
jgi:WD40 repeat protein